VLYFESTKAEMEANKLGRGAANPQHHHRLLSKSFFLLGVGGNDIFAFATAQARQNRTATQSEVTVFIGSLVSNYLNAITVPIASYLNYSISILG
jgi:hypothetical protein